VRQALEILTPVVPIRMEDANVSATTSLVMCLYWCVWATIQATLVHWTKKIIIEEGHSMAQLVHML